MGFLLYKSASLLALGLNSNSVLVHVIKNVNPALMSRKRNFSLSSKGLRMRFVQFRCRNNGPQRLGVQLSQEGDVIDVSAVDSSIPNNLVQFLEGGTALLEKAKRIVGECKSVNSLSNVELLAPVTSPDKILCVGLNYKAHCDEQNKPYPAEPFFFNKFPSTIVAPFGKVQHPPNTKKLDWEVELTIVMGKKCRNILRNEALDYVFGYTIAQDISARDWQSPKKNNGQWLFAKSMDTFCPLGPSVVVKEVFGSPNDKNIKCSVNGSLKQNSNTSDLIHPVEDLIAYLSHCVTLLPGDLILTGTPGGVGLYSNPQQFLAVGDEIQSEVSGIGKLITYIGTPCSLLLHTLKHNIYRQDSYSLQKYERLPTQAGIQFLNKLPEDISCLQPDLASFKNKLKELLLIMAPYSVGDFIKDAPNLL